MLWVGVQELRKTSGRWEFKRIWHLEHPNEFLAHEQVKTLALKLCLPSPPHLSVSRCEGTGHHVDCQSSHDPAPQGTRTLSVPRRVWLSGGKKHKFDKPREIEIIFFICTFRKCRFPENPSLKDPKLRNLKAPTLISGGILQEKTLRSLASKRPTSYSP